MASLYITEYARQPFDSNGQRVPAGEEPALAIQKVTVGVASAQSAAFNAATKFVRLHTDVICSVIFAADPTATASHSRMAANSTEFFGVVAGHKVAVITNT